MDFSSISKFSIKFSVITILLKIFFFPVYAQSVTNVTSIQDGNSAIITYDFSGTMGKAYSPKLYYSIDGGQNFGKELVYVNGDVNQSIFPGNNKKITWDIVKELGMLSGDIVFKVELQETNTSTPPPLSLKGLTVKIVSFEKQNERFIVHFEITQNTQNQDRLLRLHKKPEIILGNEIHIKIVSGNLGNLKLDEWGTGEVYCHKGVPLSSQLVFPLSSQTTKINQLKLDLFMQGIGFQSFVFNNFSVK